jgi:SAM-dependent methyltransferase
MYYDGLAKYYKLIYADWDKSLHRQAVQLNSIIQEYIGETANTVLDAACGIGTQTIGLAKLGYTVTASDISTVEVEHARQESLRYDVQIEFQIVDMRQVWDYFHKQFDVVMACDNSVPHLLNNDEILCAFQQFYKCTKPNGACIITLRDYSDVQHKEKTSHLYPRQIHQTDRGRVILFDVWDFDGDYYEMTTYIVEDYGEDSAQIKILRGGKYYCVEIPAIEGLLKKAGFREVKLLVERYFQPTLIALK